MLNRLQVHHVEVNFTDLDGNTFVLLLEWISALYWSSHSSIQRVLLPQHHGQTGAQEPCNASLHSDGLWNVQKCVCGGLCVSITFWVLRFTAVTYPSQPSFQYTLKQCCRKFSHIVVLSEAFHWSAPSVLRSIDGCPVRLSQCFRKHQRLSDEALTKGHRVEAMERRGADYWEREARERKRETDRVK